MWWRRKKRHSTSSSAASTSAATDPHAPSSSFSFSFSDLQLATENFSSQKKVQDGLGGEVYKGDLSDGTKLAVKKLPPKYHRTEPDAFLSRMSEAQHPNVVSLIGFCLEADQQFLVYEFLEDHRPLSDILFSRDDGQEEEPLCWNTRIKIAEGVAKGLAYLHDKVSVLHGDVRASAVLVDRDYGPKLSQAGMVNLLPDGDSHVNARDPGTFGYMAPEYALDGKLTEKVDVFSFGVLLLELISGRSNMDMTGRLESFCLLEWSWKLYREHRLLDIVDPRLHGDFPQDEVFRALHIALLCVQEVVNSRPSMWKVNAMLTGDLEISVFPSKPGLIQEVLPSLKRD